MPVKFFPVINNPKEGFSSNSYERSNSFKNFLRECVFVNNDIVNKQTFEVNFVIGAGRVNSGEPSDSDSSTETFLSKSDSNLSEETYASSLSSDSDTESEQNYTRENGINIYYTNADSLINKKDELDIVIQERNPDMIIITEVYPKTSKSTEISESELVIKGYDMIQSKTRKKSRGVCIYYRENLTVEPCEKLNNLAFQEACWCNVTLKQGDKLLLGAIYSPSSTMTNTNRLI